MQGVKAFRSAAFAALVLGNVAHLAAGDARAETAARARVSLPFTCTHDAASGRLRLQQSSRQTYEINDRRDTQRYLACGGDGPGEGACRPWMLHRFVMLCGGQPVPWINVVAAALAQRPGLTTSIDDGHLVISRAASSPVGASRNCFDRLAGAPIGLRLASDAWLDQCWRRQQRAAMRHEARRVVMPAGFAPAHLLGARFLPPARLAATVSDAAGPTLPIAISPSASSPAPATPVIAPAPALPAATLSPSPDAKAAPPISAPIDFKVGAAEPTEEARARQRMTFVTSIPGERLATASGPASRPEPRPNQDLSALPAAPLAAEDHSGANYRAYLLAALIAALSAAGLMLPLLRRKPRSRLDAASADAAYNVVFPRFSGPDGEAIDQLAATARDRLGHCRAAMRQLPFGLPLRQVISREVNASIERLSNLAAMPGATPEDVRRIRSRLQSVTRELQRLALIADGALSSVGSGTLVPVDLLEPRDRAEAYAVLGVNADVDPRTLKKLVDALRQSWHPDHARDETDRGRREERIKQINVAWDLVRGKRLEA